MNGEEILVFGGSGSARLTRGISEYLGVAQGKSEVIHFSAWRFCPR